MEKKNSLQQTPFLLAVSRGDFGLIHTLVSNGADINAVGADGNNCLHLALETDNFHSRREYLDVLDEFCSTLGLSKEDGLSPKVVASYLAGQGANLYHTNQRNKTPLDLIGDPVFKEKLVFFSPHAKCMLCEENQATVNFHPCGHKVTCEECSKIKLKRCPQCRQPITRKSGFESPSDTELLNEQVAQHLRIESHQAESPLLEVREPTKAAKQVGVKCVHVELQQLEVREPTNVEKQEGFKWLPVESPQLEVREPTKADKQEGVKLKQVESPQLEVREPTKEEKQEGFKWWHFGRKRKQVELPQLEVREPTNVEKQERYKRLPVESQKLEERDLIKVAKEIGVKWKHVESQKLEERDLIKVAKEIGVKWKHVGIFLGIRDNTLEIIRHQNERDIIEQAYQMLLKWSQSCGPEKRTVDVLRDALQEADCYEAMKYLPSEE